MKRTLSSQAPLGLPRRHIGAALIVLVAGLVACASPTSTTHPVVPQPRIELQPERLELAPGGEARLVARHLGGEAILFHVDWKVAEGEAGGRLEPSPARGDDGSYSARYVAPASEGVFHVVAHLREYPAAEARVEIRVRR